VFISRTLFDIAAVDVIQIRGNGLEPGRMVHSRGILPVFMRQKAFKILSIHLEGKTELTEVVDTNCSLAG